MSTLNCFKPRLGCWLRTTVVELVIKQGLPLSTWLMTDFSVFLPRLGFDVIAQAQSGTGKTATFAVSILQQLNIEVKETQALVLAPTRELAQQVCWSWGQGWHNGFSDQGWHIWDSGSKKLRYCFPHSFSKSKANLMDPSDDWCSPCPWLHWSERWCDASVLNVKLLSFLLWKMSEVMVHLSGLTQ